MSASRDIDVSEGNLCPSVSLFCFPCETAFHKEGLALIAADSVRFGRRERLAQARLNVFLLWQSYSKNRFENDYYERKGDYDHDTSS